MSSLKKYYFRVIKIIKKMYITLTYLLITFANNCFKNRGNKVYCCIMYVCYMYVHNFTCMYIILIHYCNITVNILKCVVEMLY